MIALSSTGSGLIKKNGSPAGDFNTAIGESVENGFRIGLLVVERNRDYVFGKGLHANNPILVPKDRPDPDAMSSIGTIREH